MGFNFSSLSMTLKHTYVCVYVCMCEEGKQFYAQDLKYMYVCMYVCTQGSDSYSVARRSTLTLMLQLLTALTSVCSEKDATKLKHLARRIVVRSLVNTVHIHTYIKRFFGF